MILSLRKNTRKEKNILLGATDWIRTTCSTQILSSSSIYPQGRVSLKPMLDLRVILGLHFHNLGPGRGCPEAKHSIQTKIQQTATAPETNSWFQGWLVFLSESLKKPSPCACQAAAGFPDRKERHSTKQPFKSSTMFHNSQCCKSRAAFNSSGVWVTSFPDLRKMELADGWRKNTATSLRPPLPHQNSLKLSRLGTCQKTGNG